MGATMSVIIVRPVNRSMPTSGQAQHPLDQVQAPPGQEIGVLGQALFDGETLLFAPCLARRRAAFVPVDLFGHALPHYHFTARRRAAAG